MMTQSSTNQEPIYRGVGLREYLVKTSCLGKLDTGFCEMKNEEFLWTCNKALIKNEPLVDSCLLTPL